MVIGLRYGYELVNTVIESRCRNIDGIYRKVYTHVAWDIYQNPYKQAKRNKKYFWVHYPSIGWDRKSAGILRMPKILLNYSK